MSNRRSSGIAAQIVLLGLTIACDAAPTKSKPQELACTGITGTLPGDVVFADCTDGKPRSLSCKRQADEADADIFCACMKNGELGASFMLFSDVVDAAVDPARAVDVAHRRCGWDLAAPP